MKEEKRIEKIVVEKIIKGIYRVKPEKGDELSFNSKGHRVRGTDIPAKYEHKERFLSQCFHVYLADYNEYFVKNLENFRRHCQEKGIKVKVEDHEKK